MADDLSYQELLTQYAKQSAQSDSSLNTSPATLDTLNKIESDNLPPPVPLTEIPDMDFKETKVEANTTPPRSIKYDPPQKKLPDSSVSPPPQNTESLGSFSVPLAPAFNIFKFTFILSLLSFFGVFGYLAYKVYRGDIQYNLAFNQPTPVPTTITNNPTPIDQSTCFLNDQVLSVGETFTASDGCNTCTCSVDTTIVCTEDSCTEGPLLITKTYSHSSPKFQMKYPSDWVYFTYEGNSDALYFEPEAESKDGEIRPEPENTEPPITPLKVSIIESNQIPSVIKKLKNDYSYSAYNESKMLVNQVNSTMIRGQVEAESYITGMVDHHLFVPRGTKAIHVNFIEMDSDLTVDIYNQIVASLVW